MTPFCSLKQNCNTLLVQFCYSTHLKVIRNDFGGQAESPMGLQKAISSYVSGHPDQRPSINMDSSVHLQPSHPVTRSHEAHLLCPTSVGIVLAL